MIVQLCWVDGRITDHEVMMEGPHDLIVLRECGLEYFFRLDAGRYVQCKSVVFV